MIKKYKDEKIRLKKLKTEKICVLHTFNKKDLLELKKHAVKTPYKKTTTKKNQS